jgi:hypothetical protein
MADEPEIIAPPTVLDAPSDAEFEPEQPVDLNEPEEDGEPAEGDTAEPAEEEEEFDWNGKRIRGPKGLKDGVLMHGDYTKKTQEVAATRKELEAEKARVAQQAKASEDYIEMKADHRAKARELEQYQNVDWNAWSLQDPIACQQGYIAFQNLQREAGELSQKISEADRTRSAETQQEIAKRLNETHEFAKANIKGWNDERARKVIDFAKEQGFSNEELQANLSPTTLKILHLAELGHQVLSKPAAPKPNPAATAPLQVVSGKSTPTKRDLYDPKLPMEEYAAIRTRQEAAKRGARG